MKPPMSDQIRQQIAIRAYFIWEQEGRPHGRDNQHWALAEAEILGEQPVVAAAPAKKPAKKTVKKTTAEKAPEPKPDAPKSPKKTGVKKTPAVKTKTAAKTKPPKS